MSLLLVLEDICILFSSVWNYVAIADVALSSVFLRFFKGCRGGALGRQHHFPFYVWYF